MKGDTVDVFPSYKDIFYRISFFGDEIESIKEMEYLTNKTISEVESVMIFPAEEHTGVDIVSTGIKPLIEKELEDRLRELRSRKSWKHSDWKHE